MVLSSLYFQMVQKRQPCWRLLLLTSRDRPWLRFQSEIIKKEKLQFKNKVHWDVTVLCKHIWNFEDNQCHINIFLSCVQYCIIGGNKFDMKLDSFWMMVMITSVGNMLLYLLYDCPYRHNCFLLWDVTCEGLSYFLISLHIW